MLPHMVSVVTAKFCWKHSKFAFKYHEKGKIKVLLCIYVSFQGWKFKISVITTYFDTFKLKPIIKSDNIHNFTKISIFLTC